jgi:hypothetical protein
MRVDLERKTTYLKQRNTNKQPTSSSNGRGRNEQHNTVEGERMSP